MTLLAAFSGGSGGTRAAADGPDPADWPAVLEAAEGETVYFYAWGGEPRINAYIAWAGEQLKTRFGITLVHVKVSDTADAVGRVLAEKTAGVRSGGAVDLVWVNGENFATMKAAGLLRATPWADRLPNWSTVDIEGKGRSILYDFGVPIDGLEAPWGQAQLVFLYDSAQVPAPPRTLDALARWAADNPGRFTYPQPPDFVGTTFLKQIISDRVGDAEALANPAGPGADARVDAIFADYLDPLHGHLWRKGRAFPATVSALRQLLADDEIAIAISFNPADAAAAIAAGQLPPTVRTFILDGGTIGNTHYLAIPFNANAPAAALVVADFLMSPAAQARKADPAVWGDPTITDVGALADAQRALFDAIAYGPARLSPEQLTPTLGEPHYSWTEAIERIWKRRYLR